MLNILAAIVTVLAVVAARGVVKLALFPVQALVDLVRRRSAI